MTPATKTCSRCDEQKSLDEFYQSKRASDGLRSHCKQCHCKDQPKRVRTEEVREYHRKYYQKNKETLKARSRQYYQDNIEGCRAYSRWRYANQKEEA